MLVKPHAIGQCLIQVDARGSDRIPTCSSPLWRGTRVPRSTLVEHLSPDVEPERARHCLPAVLYKLRRAGVELEQDATNVALPAIKSIADFSLPRRRTIRARAVGFGDGCPILLTLPSVGFESHAKGARRMLDAAHHEQAAGGPRRCPA
jgi:hypothetical protein